jgi:mannose-6-phosphate isomerase-like protein (cupin superfamily)
MENIKIIQTGIDVSSIKRDLKNFSSDWDCQKNIKNSDSILKYGFPEVDVGVLQLKIGTVSDSSLFVGNSQTSKETPAWHRHTAVRTTLRKHGFKSLERCGFLSMPVGGSVGRHIDIGNYYLTRDRYHLSIQGRYEYTCGDESVVIDEGTLFWFNNKLEHSATNISDVVRITFVFDVLK